jgi:nucleoside-diphosphate-sugar epimerase
MHIDGADCIFDFTHVDDVAAGVIEICRVLSNGEQKLPAIHFVSGVPTSLRELAEAAADAGSRRASFEERPPRTQLDGQAISVARSTGDWFSSVENVGAGFLSLRQLALREILRGIETWSIARGCAPFPHQSPDSLAPRTSESFSLSPFLL